MSTPKSYVPMRVASISPQNDIIKTHSMTPSPWLRVKTALLSTSKFKPTMEMFPSRCRAVFAGQ